MFCQKCGKENPDGAAFCNSCGTDLIQKEPPVASTVAISKQNEIIKAKIKTREDQRKGYWIGPMVLFFLTILVIFFNPLDNCPDNVNHHYMVGFCEGKRSDTP